MKNFVYNIFLKEFIESDIDILEDNFKAVLLSDEYEPDVSHTADQIYPYEIIDKNYSPGGKYVTLFKKTLKSGKLSMAGRVSWNKLNPEPKNAAHTENTKIGYVVIFRYPSENSKEFNDAGILPVLCQKFENSLLLKNEDLNITWDDFLIQFLPSVSSEENNSEEVQALLSKLILGKSKLGK